MLPLWLFVPAALLLANIIYNRFFHPLAKVPGPFVASLTPLWIAWQQFHARRPRLDLKLHKKYGPVVRIAPNEIMFSNPAYFRHVYGVGTSFTKSRFYEAPTDIGQAEGWEKLNMLVEKDIDKLRVQKRLAGPAYSINNAKKHEDRMDANIRRWTKRVDTSLLGRPVDIYHEFELFNVDVMTDVTFGSAFGAVEAGSDGGHMASMDKNWEWFGWMGFLPGLNALDKKYSPWSAIWFTRTAIASSKLPVFPYCVQKTMEYDSRVSEGKETAVPCLLDDLRKLTKEKPEFLKNWGTRLAGTNLGAGVDTMSWTLASIVVGIATNPACQKKVNDELDAAVKAGLVSRDEPISYDQAAKLEYLNACMHESLRIWPNIAISLPRNAPPSGISIDGYFIPEGYTVGMNSKQLGLNEEIFGADTDAFRPERWLQADKAQRHDMETRNLAFGGPSRKCPGMHLSWVSMSKVLATFHLHYEARVLNTLDGQPGPGGHVWRERGSFPTKWHGLEVEIRKR